MVTPAVCLHAQQQPSLCKTDDQNVCSVMTHQALLWTLRKNMQYCHLNQSCTWKCLLALRLSPVGDGSACAATDKCLGATVCRAQTLRLYSRIITIYAQHPEYTLTPPRNTSHTRARIESNRRRRQRQKATSFLKKARPSTHTVYTYSPTGAVRAVAA